VRSQHRSDVRLRITTLIDQLLKVPFQPTKIASPRRRRPELWEVTDTNQIRRHPSVPQGYPVRTLLLPIVRRRQPGPLTLRELLWMA
jgi:hypothetical protein